MIIVAWAENPVTGEFAVQAFWLDDDGELHPADLAALDRVWGHEPG